MRKLIAKIIVAIIIGTFSFPMLMKVIDCHKSIITPYSITKSQEKVLFFTQPLSKTLFSTADNSFAKIKDDSYELLAQLEAERQARIEAEERAKREAKITEQLYSAGSFKVRGILNWGNYKWTWYSERVLPGGGLNIPGRHADNNGYICDENNFICLASSTLPKGTIVNTPLGRQGKVYDSGCATGVVDVYVNW